MVTVDERGLHVIADFHVAPRDVGARLFAIAKRNVALCVRADRVNRRLAAVSVGDEDQIS